MDGKILPPISVGVWIPKAKLGPTANFFRPLGMPSTFERLLDCAVAAHCVKMLAPYLHPAQTLLNVFREPQGAVIALQDTLDSPAATVALSLDLSKAFERVNPFWILQVLRRRGAPSWVCRYACYVLFGRAVRHKVQGRLLPPRRIHVGVDMGQSFSVLLFCVAMDPILCALNSIQGVLNVQGYVDDTTVAGDVGGTMTWLGDVGSLLDSLRSAGIQVDPHTCWKVAAVTHSHPFRPCRLDDHPEFAWVHELQGHATLHGACSRISLLL